jgi:hypothetical protein
MVHHGLRLAQVFDKLGGASAIDDASWPSAGTSFQPTKVSILVKTMAHFLKKNGP